MVEVSWVFVPAANLVVRTFYSKDLTPCLMLKILVVESCEVIVDASVDVHVQLKLLPVMVLMAVHPDAKDYCDSSLPDGSSLETVGDGRTLHQQKDAREVTSD